MWFIPLLLLGILSFCTSNITTLFSDLLELNYTAIYPIVSIIAALIFIILCFMAMMWYGYRSVKKIYSDPENKTERYMPLLFPAVWYACLTAVMNVLDLHATDLLGLIIHSFIAVNPFGYYVLTFFVLVLPMKFTEAVSSVIHGNHIMLLCGLLYYAFLILGFAAGERLYVRKMNETRKPFVNHKKKLIILCTVVIAIYSMSEFALLHNRKNVVSTARTANSYGFAYEGGYSSTNLKPYYVENESNILAKLDEPSTFIIVNPLDMPVLDGAEAVYPVYSAFANACYANIAEIQTYGKEQSRRGTVSEEFIVMPIQFSNTIYAYEDLLSGEVDICFGAKPSEEQLQMAEEQGKEVVLTPIGKEGFVFFVNDANPVDSLTTQQLRDIYSGEITNWRKLGGTNDKILAFQRPENSGSQTMMKYFMGDTPLKEPLEAEYYEAMSGVLRDVAAYDNGTSSIAYSFRYFATIMAEDDENNDKQATGSNAEYSDGIKFLAVDGVYPDEDTIRSGEYPLTTELYAITVIDKYSPTGTYSKDTIEPFLEWMTGPQGQQIVADTGYVSLE